MLRITHKSFLKFLSDIYLLIKSTKFCQMPFLQNIEMSCQLQMFQIDAWRFFKVCKFCIHFNFSYCCCYFVICIPICSFFNVYIELNYYYYQLNCSCKKYSLSLNGYIYLKIQREIPLDLAILYKYCPLAKL